MSAFVVEGGRPLHGEVRISGNKNEALPCIAASLLSPGPVVLDNVPDILDVRSMLAIAAELGATVSPITAGRVTITADTMHTSTLPLAISRSIRGSILFASALLVRCGRAAIPEPGGDTIGRRRIDTHFLAFQALGASLTVERSRQDESAVTTYTLTAPAGGLTGGDIFLDEASVTATENALIAAAGARGTSTIANAASEPHVQGLCHFLTGMGVRIEGIGSNILIVQGNPAITSGTNHRLGCDIIEAGSFVGVAAATRSALTITDVDTDYMRMILFQFRRLGIHTTIDRDNRAVHIPADQSLTVQEDLGGAIPRIADNPWPAFPPDMTSVILVTATQCTGTCMIHERMFESRLFFTTNLIDMGARIVLCDPHRAVVAGPTRLYGMTFSSPDIRAGMALLIAALTAEGTSTIFNIRQIDRGYQNIDGRLRSLGARIDRMAERRAQ